MSPMLGSLLFAVEIVIEIEIEFSTMHIFKKNLSRFGI